MAAWVYLALTLVLLIFQIHLAVRARPIFRVVLIGQSIFWMAAYVLRSAYFLVVKPTNSIMLADPRLVHDGYSEVLSQVLVVVFWGTFTYVGTLWLFLRNSLTRNQSSTGNQPHDQYGVQQINTLTILYGLGWLGRFAFLMNWSKYLSGALMPLAVVSGALLVAYAKRGRLTFLPNSVIFVALAEVGWAFIFESKTAFFFQSSP